MKFQITTKKPIYCKVCFKEIRFDPLRYILEDDFCLCSDCLYKVQKKLSYRKVSNINVLFLSSYDSIMREWLLQYKEYLDYELAPVFLSPFKKYLHILFHNYIFIPCPSSEKKIKERGFSHLEEMLKKVSLPYLSLLVKDDDSIQKSLSRDKRIKDKHIHVKDGINIDLRKKYVLFDDVMTSSATFLQSINALKKAGVNIKYGVILLDNYNLEKHKLN